MGVSSVMIVEDSSALRGALAAALAERGVRVTSCAGARDACAMLLQETPDLLLLDVHLPDGSAFDVVEVARSLRPRPVVVAMSGKASADEAFELAQVGVSAYLSKPIDLRTLNQSLDRATCALPDLDTPIRRAVGKLPVKDAERMVRVAMVDEALARSGGSVRGAARLLDVSRELLQHALRGLGGSRARSGGKKSCPSD